MNGGFSNSHSGSGCASSRSVPSPGPHPLLPESPGCGATPGSLLGTNRRPRKRPGSPPALTRATRPARITLHQVVSPEQTCFLSAVTAGVRGTRTRWALPSEVASNRSFAPSRAAVCTRLSSRRLDRSWPTTERNRRRRRHPPRQTPALPRRSRRTPLRRGRCAVQARGASQTSPRLPDTPRAPPTWRRTAPSTPRSTARRPS